MTDEQPEDRIHYFWIIYDKPLDYPNGYAARLWVRPVGFDLPLNSEITIKCDTLEEVREALTANKVKWFMDRNESDHQTIVEIWE